MSEKKAASSSQVVMLVLHVAADAVVLRFVIVTHQARAPLTHSLTHESKAGRAREEEGKRDEADASKSLKALKRLAAFGTDRSWVSPLKLMLRMNHANLFHFGFRSGFHLGSRSGSSLEIDPIVRIDPNAAG